jgi:DNA-binding CsgD family transcriptional regulator
MAYRSAISENRRSVLLTGASVGALFSLVSSLTFGRIGPLNAAAFLSFGVAEGLLISGTGIAIQAIVPGGTRRRLPRLILDFVMGSTVHILLGFALAFLGAHILFLTGIVGLLSMVVGELVVARESAILAREEADLAKEGRVRLPPRAKEAFGLSDRELEVAELLLAHASYRDICERLYISLPTVKSHVSSIYRKSDVASRREFISASERIRSTTQVQ